jgi:hypothetical protein
VGDQILDVNGKSFLNISHEEAVRVLKSSQQLVIMLKDVGMLPHGKRIYDETRWIRDTETKHSPRFEQNTYPLCCFEGFLRLFWPNKGKKRANSDASSTFGAHFEKTLEKRFPNSRA